jgi:hypothetical protein
MLSVRRASRVLFPVSKLIRHLFDWVRRNVLNWLLRNSCHLRTSWKVSSFYKRTQDGKHKIQESYKPVEIIEFTFSSSSITVETIVGKLFMDLGGTYGCDSKQMLSVESQMFGLYCKLHDQLGRAYDDSTIQGLRATTSTYSLRTAAKGGYLRQCKCCGIRWWRQKLDAYQP